MGKIKLVNSSRVTKIMATCAFGFALISFVSTALGLNEFAFTGKEAWKGFLLSFCVQGLLLTLNLNMSRFFQYLKSNGWAWWKKWVIVLYVVMLFTSSFFSFVFITNLAYDKTYYADTQAIAEQRVMEEIIGAQEKISTELEKIVENIQEDLTHKQDIDVVMPPFAELSFSYTVKDIVAPTQEGNIMTDDQSVVIKNEYARTEPQIVNRYKEVKKTKEKIKTTISRLSNLNRIVRNLSGRTIKDSRQDLTDAYGIANQLLIEVEEYQTEIGKIDANIRNNENRIEQHNENSIENEKNGVPKELNYEGMYAYIKGIENEYYTYQRDDYAAFSSLLEVEGKSGDLQGWYDILSPAYDSDRLSALFVEASTALEKGKDDAEYKKARERLYDAISFVTSYGKEVGWSYQKFDEQYTKFESLSDASNIFKNVRTNISQIEMPAILKLGENTSDQKEWKEKWKQEVDSLHGGLLSLAGQLDKDKYDATASATSLTNLWRNYFTEDLSAVEQAAKRLVSTYNGKAIFALGFAFFMDLSSLIVGLIIYVRDNKNTGMFQEGKIKKLVKGMWKDWCKKVFKKVFKKDLSELLVKYSS